MRRDERRVAGRGVDPDGNGRGRGERRADHALDGPLGHVGQERPAPRVRRRRGAPLPLGQPQLGRGRVAGRQDGRAVEPDRWRRRGPAGAAGAPQDDPRRVDRRGGGPPVQGKRERPRANVQRRRRGERKRGGAGPDDVRGRPRRRRRAARHAAEDVDGPVRGRRGQGRDWGGNGHFGGQGGAAGGAQVVREDGREAGGRGVQEAAPGVERQSGPRAGQPVRDGRAGPRHRVRRGRAGAGRKRMRRQGAVCVQGVQGSAAMVQRQRRYGERAGIGARGGVRAGQDQRVDRRIVRRECGRAAERDRVDAVRARVRQARRRGSRVQGRAGDVRGSGGGGRAGRGGVYGHGRRLPRVVRVVVPRRGVGRSRVH